MLFELIATVVVGFGAAGIVLLMQKALRGRLPRWLIPAAAGASMIAFTIWSEYTWFSRTAETLPDGVEVAWSNEEKVFFRPWTYLFPNTTRFMAVDLTSERTHPDQPGQKMVDLYLMGRWAPNRRVTVVMDCANQRRADLLGETTLGPNGTVRNASWVEVPDSDPVLQTACKGGASG